MERLIILSLLILKVNCALDYYYNNTLYGDEAFSDELEKIYNKDLQMNWSPEDELHATELDEVFDFIVVGSGSAGSVVANRLSEINDWNILLLEIGEAPPDIAEIPMLLPYLQFSDYNWKYLSEKQRNVGLGLEQQRHAWPRGKALGGSSSINYMLHVRGNRLDYDRWSENGNKGWSYEEVLPYFKKSEDFHVKFQDPEYHQHGGYQSVSDVNYRTESAHVFVKGMQEFGFKYVDYNGREQMGVSYVHATCKNGKKVSGYKAFLLSIKGRQNLKVYTGARITKVLIDKQTKSAYGVNFIKNGRNFIARASKEVILSAGVLNSPQLLMLSGIGPKNHLNELGIHVLQDLPVGQKLYDHLAYLGLTFTVNDSITFDNQLVQNTESFIEFLTNGTGPLTSIANAEALSFIKTSVSDHSDPSYPDIELIFTSTAFHSDKGELSTKVFRIADETYNAFWKPLEGIPSFTIFPVALHPKSYGHLKLKSRNPYQWPRFYGNYFTDPENHDVKTLIASIRFIQKLIKMPSFQRYNTKMWNKPVPGCKSYLYNSDSYWECALRHLSASVFHQVGTCKMGPPTDPEAVVNDELKVNGIDNLRVVDASIMPQHVAAHTSIPTFMIGEKASDLIKNTWLCDYRCSK